MNKRQRVFAQEYLKDLNGSQAAIRAGYSPRGSEVTASKLLIIPKVAELVKKGMEARAKRTEITQDWVINRLRQIAGTDMSDIADWNQSGISFKESSSLSEGARVSIQQIEQVMNEYGGTIKIKQYDKIRALELLGKHLGMFTEKAEVAHTFQRPHADVPDEDLEIAIEEGEKID